MFSSRVWAIRPVWSGTVLLLSFLLLSKATSALAQINVPSLIWNESFDRTSINAAGVPSTSPVCTVPSVPSKDWSWDVKPTKDGGYINAGYAYGTTSTSNLDCPGTAITPMISKHNAQGQVVWSHLYHPATGVSGTGTQGLFREIVELAGDSGYAAIGWHVVSGERRAFFVKIDGNGALLEDAILNYGSGQYAFHTSSGTTTGTITGSATDLTGKEAMGLSIRQILTQDANGIVRGHGFIIGGLAQTSIVHENVLEGSESSGETDSITTANDPNRIANATVPDGLTHTFVYQLYMVRLLSTPATPTMAKVWERVYGQAGTVAASCAARPIYANGTRHNALLNSRIAKTPLGGLVGFAFTGGIFNTIPGSSNGNNTNMIVLRTSTTGVEQARQVYGDRAMHTIPYCTPNSADLNTDFGSDLEQRESGELAVVTSFNLIGWNRCFPPDNPNWVWANPPTNTIRFYAIQTADCYMYSFARDFANGSSSTPDEVYIGQFAGAEFRPQVEPTPEGGYAIGGSRLTSANDTDNLEFELNRFWLLYYDDGIRSSSTGVHTTNPRRRWDVTFPGPVPTSTKACAYGLCLTTDGGYVLSGNDGANGDDVVLAKHLSCLDYSSGLTISTSDTWSSGLRIRGTVTVQTGKILTIGNGAVIKFDDTRETVTGSINGLTSTLPSRIVVEVGGKLIIQGGAKLTSLSDQPSECTTTSTAYMWDGIVVKGNPTANQLTDSNQGVVVINNGTIENARYGILACRPSYNSSQLLVPDSRDGGGIVRATDATFRNCYVGAHLMTYNADQNIHTSPDHGPDNESYFTKCHFLADNYLADDYYTGGSGTTYSGKRYGMQIGVRVYGTSGIHFLGNNFELIDFAQPSQSTVEVLASAGRGTGISVYNSVVYVQPTTDATPVKNTFKRLYYGMNVNNNMGYFIKVQTSKFDGNRYGLYLTGSASSTITNNIFDVGRSSDTFDAGLLLYNTAGFQVEGNYFASNSQCTTTSCGSTRGLIVTLSDRTVVTNTGTEIVGSELYRNNFDSLSTAIYAQNGNSRLQLRCNDFTDNTPSTSGTIYRADIEVAIGTNSTQDSYLGDPQGACGSDDTPANNLFSHTCNSFSTSAKDILVSGTFSDNVERKLDYTYHNSTSENTRLRPGTSSTACYTNTKVDQADCGGSSLSYRGYATVCPDETASSLSVSEMLAALDTLTDATARARVIDALLRHYLTSGSYIHGVDSAAALLNRVGDAAYADQLSDLESRITAGSSERVAGPSRHHAIVSRKAIARENSSGTARRGGSTDSYFQQVRDLLAPLGSDSAITATLLADSTLRNQLLTIANDTLTWGYVAGQAALTRYLGYEFTPWFQHEVTENGQRLVQGTPASIKRLNCAQVYPNPTTGEVRVAYQLPARVPQATIQIHDGLGRIVRTVACDSEHGEVVLQLGELPSGLYSYSLAAPGRVLQSGKLVKLP